MITNDWHKLEYGTMIAFHPISFIVFVLIIFIPGIFGSNLIIAVLKISYRETMDRNLNQNMLDETQKTN
jgi:hypothetical protein